LAAEGASGWRPLPDLAAVDALGQALAAALRPGDVVLLEGPLGAGKTALVRALAAALGHPAGQVTSPTFALVHQLAPPAAPTPDLPASACGLLHADLYRLHGADALAELGLLDQLGAPDLIGCVEWPGLLEGELGGLAVWRVALRDGPARAAAVTPPAGAPR
jgi:tRNA threonylcarbamoyladenosine biosynthesis protein TsaE